MQITTFLTFLVLAAIMIPASPSAAQTVRRVQPANAAIATAVWAGDTLYVSGQLPNPVTPADPAKGNTMDFAGMMAPYTQFFGTPAQPNKPARSTVQVAALVARGALVEIDVVAARSK